MSFILPAAEKKPSFSQRLNAGIGRGLEFGQQLMNKKQAQEQMQAENEAAKRMGIDLSGIQDPKMRQEALKIGLEGSQQQQLLQQKQGFLGNLFGGQEKTQQQPGQMHQQGFDASSIPDEVIAQASAVDPNIGRALMHAKDVSLREKRESPEMKREQQIASSQAQADVKYNQELQSAEKQHKLKSQSLDRLEKLNLKGVTGKPFEKILEKSGLINLTSEGRREFAADVKNLITDIRSILGSQFSQFEFSTILNAYPSADFSKEANASIIKNLKEFQDIRNKEFEIAKQIKKENGGKIPPDFQALVNQGVEQYAQSKIPEIKENSRKIMNEEYGISEGNVLMFDPQGEPLNVSPDQVEYFESLGAVLP